MPKREAIYTNLISIRSKEIEYFWQRGVFLFGIQGVILSFFIGSFNSLINNDFEIILIITAIFGFVFAIFICIILYESKNWVDYWEAKCKKFEDKYKVKFSLFDMHLEEKKPFKGYYSTKSLLVSLSVLFMIFWAVILVYLFRG